MITFETERCSKTDSSELLLFAKAPRPGLVKTRLAAALGKVGACDAYCTLLRVVGSRLRPVANVTVCFSPDDAELDLKAFFPSWPFEPQTGADLGERLRNAIERSLERGATKVAVVGCDCPYLALQDIHEAWGSLDDHDLVLGPAEDGGYWLVATRRSHPELFFGIHWSTPQVLAQTLARAKELRLSVRLLRQLPDIDTPADWEAFCSTQVTTGS